MKSNGLSLTVLLKILVLELMDQFGLSELKTEKTELKFSKELTIRNGNPFQGNLERISM
jgi:hypothetical protein